MKKHTNGSLCLITHLYCSMYEQKYTQKLTLETNLFYLEVSAENTANVIALGTTTLDMYIDVIEKVLSIYDHDIAVNFDLLLKNGIDKRYYSAIFSQETKSITPLKKEVPQKRDIEIMNTFLLENIHLFEQRFIIGDDNIYRAMIEMYGTHIDELKELIGETPEYLLRGELKMKLDHHRNDFFVHPNE